MGPLKQHHKPRREARAVRKRWSFPNTKRALMAVLAMPTLVAAVVLSVGLAFGLDLRPALLLSLGTFAIFAVPAAPIVLTYGLSSDAIDEAKEHIAQRQIVQTREKHPVAGAISIASDGGDLSEATEDQPGAVIDVPE